MDNRQFDDLARKVASIGWSRRRIIQHLAQGGIAALVAWRPDESAAKKKRKKKKKKKKKPVTPSCKPDCTGKWCGDFDGCAGTCTACPAGKTCQNNGCVDIACTPTCGGKVCGDPDGCGGICTACPSGQTCQGNQCVADACNPPCLGAHFCQNGSCVCPAGMKSCDSHFCGECCSTAECPGFPDPNGLQCGNEEAGVDILTCRCPNGVDCGDGRCVQCCNSDFCVDLFGPGKFCNVNGGCQCPEGTQQCSKEQGCRDTKTDRFACGPNCIACPPGQLCENGNCCFGLAIDCSMNLDGCCSGLGCVNIGTVFEPNFVCGVPL